MFLLAAVKEFVHLSLVSVLDDAVNSFLVLNNVEALVEKVGRFGNIINYLCIKVLRIEIVVNKAFEDSGLDFFRLIVRLRL